MTVATPPLIIPITPPHNFARNSSMATRKLSSEIPDWASLATSIAFSRAESLKRSILEPRSRIDKSIAASCAMIRRRDSSQLEYSSVSAIGLSFGSLFPIRNGIHLTDQAAQLHRRGFQRAL